MTNDRYVSKIHVIAYILIVGAFLFLPIESFARAGGGGSGGGGGGGGGLLAIILMPFFLIYTFYINSRLNKKNARVERALVEFSQQDKMWNEARILNNARQSFIELQQAWSMQDLATMKRLLHPTLYPVWESQIRIQKMNNEVNTVSDVIILSILIVDARNYLDDERDCFTVCIDAWANDVTKVNNIVTKSNKDSFREFWTFERENDEWLLLEVYQSSSWRKFVGLDIIYEQKT